ncbi:hypothetical protein G210_4899 [Candida maltosa Xu316]|uniref:PLAT domain-containing protein n=1 Tax=Candida maltosa (strain Xu316) TaxID=1245528 RepID=M3JD58_CANMX|nr:hypothetical protein G210_4899 [Candida maltosa Xu316]
MVKFYSSSWV